MKTFGLGPHWGSLAGRLGLRPAALLRRAGLPEDLFQRPRPVLSGEELARLYRALDAAMGDDPAGLYLGRAISPDTFHPPEFAAFCSSDLTHAVRCSSAYHAVAGPWLTEAHVMTGGLELTVSAWPDLTLPSGLIAAELVRIVALARQATGEAVRPVAIEMKEPPAHPQYAEFFGHPILDGPFNRVVFWPRDAKRAFLPPDPALFATFPHDLQPRLDQVAEDAGLDARVRAVLMEALPAGCADISTVAERLGTSPRSLQRRLAAEGAGFQDVLRDLRDRLARDYLQRTYLTGGEVAFLLGYDDPNSFTRAFHAWTGTTPDAFRRSGERPR